jgi:capsid protein
MAKRAGSIINRIRSAWSILSGTSDYNAASVRRSGNRGRIGNMRGGTANEVLSSNLGALRLRCRQLDRNHPTARAFIDGKLALVVGTGIDVRPDTGDEGLDRALSDVIQKWAHSAGINGETFYDLQRFAYREEVVAGEGLGRFVFRDKFPRILPLESEWIEDVTTLAAVDPDGSMWVGGVHIDAMGNPTEYRLRNPETTAPGTIATLSAGVVLHNYNRKRAFQARGEPDLAPIIETLQQEEDLIYAELEAAKNTAGHSVFIESEYTGETAADEAGDPVEDIPVGSVVRGMPGEKATMLSHTRPSQQIAPFSQFLRHRMAAAGGVPVRMLDRDVSRANFSSMQADMIDTERILAPVRERFGHQYCGKVYQYMLPYWCMMIGAKAPESKRYRLIPDAVPYVNPRVDIEAAGAAITNNLSTLEREAGKRGEDWREIIKQKNIEAIEVAKGEVERLTEIQKAVNIANAVAPGLNLSWAKIATIQGATSAPGAYLEAADPPASPDEPAKEPPTTTDPDDAERSSRSKGSMRHAEMLDTIRAIQPPAPAS